LSLSDTCALFDVLFRPVDTYSLLMITQKCLMFAVFFRHADTENYANI